MIYSGQKTKALQALAYASCILFLTSCGNNKATVTPAPPSNSGVSQGNSTPNGANTTPAPPLPLPPVTDNSPCPKYPIMLLHGFLAGSRIGAFAGAKDHFQNMGCKVAQTEVSTVNSVEVRGTQIAGLIKQFLAATGASKVNIIAHSQGGLDARFAMSSLGMGSSVASLSTISTPHYGTQVADTTLLAVGNPLMSPIANAMLNIMTGIVSTQNMLQGDTAAAMTSLSTSYVINRFNPNNPDVPGVYYQSWGARTGMGTSDRMKIMFLLTQPLLSAAAGENDGVIPVASSKWGNFRGVLDADHLDLVGLKLEDQVSPFDHIKFLDSVASDLKTKGF